MENQSKRQAIQKMKDRVGQLTVLELCDVSVINFQEKRNNYLLIDSFINNRLEEICPECYERWLDCEDENVMNPHVFFAGFIFEEQGEI